MPSLPVTNESAVPGSSLVRLRQACRELFVERGYHETRPQDIARKAGVANGTFYLHFADKQQAFLDFAEQAQSELIRVMSQRLQGVTASRERWRVTCDVVVEFGADHPGLLQAAFIDPVFVAPNNDDAWRMYDRLGHLVSMTLKDDENAIQDIDHELISHGLCGLLRHAMIYAGRRDMDRNKLVDDLSRFIDRGLGQGLGQGLGNSTEKVQED